MKNLDDDVLADASAMMAQAYINLDSIDAALPYMKLAAETVRDNELKGTIFIHQRSVVQSFRAQRQR